MGHVGMGWVMEGCVAHVGWVGYAGVGWVIQGWGGSCRGGVGLVGIEWAVKNFTE